MMKLFKSTVSVILSMLLFIILVKFSIQYQEQFTYAVQVLISYVLLINLYGIFIMYKDKKKSMRNGSRISERQLFIVTALGGFVGTTLGMRLLRHKTKKMYFRVLFPLISIVELAAIVTIVAFLEF